MHSNFGSRASFFLAALSSVAFGTSPGDAMQQPNPFNKIVVVAGASPNAASRTLAELKQILADKVTAGDISQEEANRILSKYGTVLTIYAQGASPLAPVQSAPVTVKVINQAPAAAPPEAPTIAPIAANPPPKPDFATLPTVAVNVTAFNELANVLGSRRRGRERNANNAYAAAPADSGSTASGSGFSDFSNFGVSGNEGRAIVDPGNGSIVRALVPNEVRPVHVVAGAPKRGQRSLARASGENGASPTGLSTSQRFRMLAGWDHFTDENGEPIDPPYPPWLNWFFASVLAGLFARAGYQWKKDRL